MSFDLTGKIIVIEDEMQISDTFKKREFVIYVENQSNVDWSDYIKFQLAQDKCALVDSLGVGDTIKVSFNIRGRKWSKDDKVNYFSSLEAWKIDTISKAAQANNSAPPLPNDADDLPF